MGLSVTPPSGFRDCLPDSCLRRAGAAAAISKVYRSFGFMPIATPAVESLEVLMGKGAGENEKLIFKILKRGEKLAESLEGGELADLGLRFDLTLPLARFYSRYAGQLPRPFKAFQIGPVWRAERAQKGRYREFYQCDADIIGSESLLCEVEVIHAISSAFLALKIPQPAVIINDRSLLHAVLAQAQVPQEKAGQVCVLLDKLDKVEREEVLAELAPLVGAAPVRTLESALMSDQPDLDRLRAADAAALARLLEIQKTLAGLLEPGCVKISPSLARGLDYYTGTVFEFRLPGLSGSLGGGGRYDRLTEKFGGAPVPACGGSLGFERLMLLLEESSESQAPPGPDACVTVFSKELRSLSIAAARKLRAAGWETDLYAGTGKLKAQFKYADARHAKLAVIIGPEEAAGGQVKVKDLKTGEERLLSLEELRSRAVAGE
ncbi:MAG: histidine--tRNA ligase [Elusimicrobia bacterium]|nr:histidine--tRNA ligase [Elusimicrobiota bacterium]